MAGRQTVALKAVADLFALKPYVLTPVAHRSKAVKTVEKLPTLGSTVHHCRPNDHDRAVSWILFTSHGQLD